MPTKKKAAKKAAKPKKRSVAMTDYEETQQQPPEVVPPNTQAANPAPTGSGVETAPTAEEGEKIPKPSEVPPGSLVDMRIRHDPSHMAGGQLLPTTDPNFKYFKPATEPEDSTATK